MIKAIVLSLFVGYLSIAGIYGQEVIKYQQDIPFTEIAAFPTVKDTAKFISSLYGNCHLKRAEGWDQQLRETINHFEKFQMFGSKEPYYLIELDWKSGIMATYPWKYQFIFDEHGKLMGILDGLRFEMIKVFENNPSFLLTVVSTAKGNGHHELYRIKKTSRSTY